VGLGIVVGLAAEARIARRLAGTVAIGGGGADGAEAASHRLVAGGATELLSFGLIPATVLDGATRHAVNTAMAGRFGGPTPQVLLGGTAIAASVDEKRRLRAATGADAIDLESGAVARVAARNGLPFAVLRAICDPADQDLPPAALVALDSAGAIGLLRVLAALAVRPAQLPALLLLARHAAAAAPRPARRYPASCLPSMSITSSSAAVMGRRGVAAAGSFGSASATASRPYTST
jgi:adenosylhomocysteine nucleosidase